MKNKVIISIAACLLFVLAGFSAFAGERVYIREYASGGAKVKVFIWQEGVTKELEFMTGMFGKVENNRENLNEFATLLESYMNQGFKMVSSINKGNGASIDIMTEYILEKP
jgi:hypothetical protein